MVNKKIAVTGGTGYIAGLVIKEFLEHGYEVTTSVRSTEKGEQLKALMAKNVSPEAAGELSTFVAELSQEEGWETGFQGCSGIIHVASPLGSGKERADELTAISVGGTLNVLAGAVKAGVKRVVMTSSEAAATPRKEESGVLTESFWSDESNPELDAYRLSKIRSERAAWKFAKEQGLQLTTILPGAVFGPILTGSQTISSNEILQQMLNGKLPFTVKVPFNISDARDVALLHRLAFEQQQAIGERYLAGSQVLMMPEVARILKVKYPDKKSPKFVAPDWLIRAASHIMPELKGFATMMGRDYSYSCEKAESQLGWQQHDAEQTILEAAESLLGNGLV